LPLTSFLLDVIYPINHLALDDSLFVKIKQSGITKYIKTLKEMNVDFIALEQQIFSMDMPLSLFPLYAPLGLSTQQQTLEKISKKASICLIS
jgi:syntaxin-binding protein 1